MTIHIYIAPSLFKAPHIYDLVITNIPNDLKYLLGLNFGVFILNSESVLMLYDDFIPTTFVSFSSSKEFRTASMLPAPTLSSQPLTIHSLPCKVGHAKRQWLVQGHTVNLMSENGFEF